MGFMDNLRKLTQPYGDEDDFYEGAEGADAPQAAENLSDAQLEFESSFAEEPSGNPEPAAKPQNLSTDARESTFLLHLFLFMVK